jgi:hypothetical protein
MSTLLIVGNGFDLNLGLKTSYKDFISSPIFESIISKNYLATHLKEKLELNNWVDIELELKNYTRLNDENLKADYYNLSEILHTFLSQIDTSKINLDSHSYKLIESLNLNDLAIVDFNYTESIFNIIKQNAFLRINGILNPSQYMKIHGSLRDNNIIFGIEDNDTVSKDYIFLNKSFKKNFGLENPYRFLNTYGTIIFFGLSLGQTDHMYFSDFFINNSKDNQNKEIKFYYYGEDGYEDLHKQIDALTRHSTAKFKYFNKVEFIDTSSI